MKYLDTDFKDQGLPQRRYLTNIKDGETFTWDLDNHQYRKSILNSLGQNLKNFPGKFSDELTNLNYTREACQELEFYLNIGELVYKDIRYPLFYVRLSVERIEVKEFLVEPDQQFYFHTRLMDSFAAQANRYFSCPNRMYHTGQFEGDGLRNQIDTIMDSICEFFELESISLFDNEVKQVQNKSIEIRNSLAIALFDKSDDSVINDYEELLRVLSDEESREFDMFESLTESFIYNNPVSFNKSIEDQYNIRKFPERFSYESPIALNKEQQQILMAVRNDTECNRIVIEGPPGTGKSHTITAIIYDALLRGKTVLVTSDKEEALNVVISKMDQVLKSVSNATEICNPILRLDGKSGNLYKVLDTSNSKKISDRVKVFEPGMDKVKYEMQMYKELIESMIIQEVDINKKLNSYPLSKLREFDQKFEDKFAQIIHIEEVSNNQEIIREIYFLITKLHELRQFDSLGFKEVELLLQKVPNSFLLGGEIGRVNLQNLTTFIEEFSKFSFMSKIIKRKQLKQIEKCLQDIFVFSKLSSPNRAAKQLKIEYEFYKILDRIEKVDLFQIIRDGDIRDYLYKSKEFNETREKYKQVSSKIPNTSGNIEKGEQNSLLNTTIEEIEDLILYLKNIKEYEKCYLDLAGLEIKDKRHVLETRNTMQLMHLLDKRLIEFLELYRNDAADLKKIIRQKKQFKKGHVELLLKAAPILVVGIRNLGNYLPLEKDLFDLLIIDEASQVSVAQAFPAIIRAKKTVVLGDSKQFDNVKSYKANKGANEREFTGVRKAFEREIDHLPAQEKELKLSKVNNFGIRTNILNFMQGIANYHTMLTKHFRGYKELIQFSNETFYNKSLQVLKIRGVSLKEIIQFYSVDALSPQKGKEKINHEEAIFVLGEIKKLKHSGFKGTIGVLSPTTDQVRYIKSLIALEQDATYYKSAFNLEVFTFDSCQGEERDIIYYSLVEREGQNILSNIFMVDETRFDEGEDAPEHLKRLNVGFSRAKEGVRFVLSKPIDKYKGNIKNALLKFKEQLEGKDYVQLFKLTDPKSAMENPALQCIIQTDFIIQNQNDVEIIPQFPIGEYIKQLDPYAPVRKYVCDFLIIYKKGKKVIVEYDGLKDHFKPDIDICLENYQEHYLEDHIERKRTIELYGYPIIDLNKFHMRNNPINYLNESFEKHFSKYEYL